MSASLQTQRHPGVTHKAEDNREVHADNWKTHKGVTWKSQFGFCTEKVLKKKKFFSVKKKIVKVSHREDSLTPINTAINKCKKV